MEYTAAQQLCADQGAILPVPENQAQNDEYMRAFWSVSFGDHWYWLGVSDAEEEGVFVNLNSGEPGTE